MKLGQVYRRYRPIPSGEGAICAPDFYFIRGPCAMADAAPPEAISSEKTAQLEANARSLPSYARSLLKVSVPVSVTLAAKRQSVREVIDLVPGSLITFDKPCDELLELAVNERLLARGEAVKVGESFGLRIAEIVLPEERFAQVPGNSKSHADQSA